LQNRICNYRIIDPILVENVSEFTQWYSNYMKLFEMYSEYSFTEIVFE